MRAGRASQVTRRAAQVIPCDPQILRPALKFGAHQATVPGSPEPAAGCGMLPDEETVVVGHRMADHRLPAAPHPEVRVARLPLTIPAGGRESVPSKAAGSLRGTWCQ